MSWAALTSGGKDSILSCQKAIDSGKIVKYMVTARPKNRESSMFHSANLDAVPVIARVCRERVHRVWELCLIHDHHELISGGRA